VKSLHASDWAINDRFGSAVSIEEDTVVVGAYTAGSGGTNRGQAYIFQKDLGGSDNWGQANILNASDRLDEDKFGNAVSISGNTIIAGAYAASGGAYTGKAYIFGIAPAVTGISPASGSTAGGTSVTITGTGFTGATTVRFGVTPNATGAMTVNSDTSITVTSPPGSAGTVDVTVSNPWGTSDTVAADQFTYVAAPTVTSISPTSGPVSGGTSVTITGTGFTGATAVNFGGTAAAGFTINSATQITATSRPVPGPLTSRLPLPGAPAQPPHPTSSPMFPHPR
jgi:hypothetical protein